MIEMTIQLPDEVHDQLKRFGHNTSQTPEKVAEGVLIQEMSKFMPDPDPPTRLTPEEIAERENQEEQE